MQMLGWSFGVLRLKDDAIRAKIQSGPSEYTTLAAKGINSEIFVGAWKLQFASIGCELASRCPGIMTWQKHLCD